MKSDRKFDVWTIQPAFADEPVDVEIRMTNDNDAISFYASVERRDKLPSSRIEDTDIRRLHTRIREAIDSEDPVAWTPKMLVCVGETRAFRPPCLPDFEPDEKASEGYSLSIYQYDQGVSAAGKTFWRTARGEKTRPGGWTDPTGRRWNVRKGVLYDPEKHETVGQLSGKYAVVLLDDSTAVREAVDKMMKDVAVTRRELIAMTTDGSLARMIKALGG